MGSVKDRRKEIAGRLERARLLRYDLDQALLSGNWEETAKVAIEMNNVLSGVVALWEGAGSVELRVIK